MPAREADYLPCTRLRHSHKDDDTYDEQDDETEYAHARVAGELRGYADKKGTQNRSELVENIIKPEKPVSVLLRHHPREVRPAQRLDAALRGSNQHRKHPEVERRLHEICIDTYDDIDADADVQHDFAREPIRQTPVQHRERGSDDLRDEQYDEQVGRFDAQIGPIGGGHRNDRTNAVDVEKISEQEKENRAMLLDLL